MELEYLFEMSTNGVSLYFQGRDIFKAEIPLWKIWLLQVQVWGVWRKNRNIAADKFEMREW